MRRWKPQSSVGPWLALALLALCLAGAALPASRLMQIFSGPPESWPIGPPVLGWTVLLLALAAAAAALAYRTAAAFTLSYQLDRNGLYITWLGNRAVIPLDQITSLDAGIALDPLPLRVLQQIGYYWGQATSLDDRPVHLFSTRSPARSLAIHTPGASYLIAPADSDTFVQELEQRRNLGATKPLTSTIESGRMFLYSFWNDPAIRLLLLTALALNLLALAILSVRYPDLPLMIEMRFDPTGQVADVRPRYQALFFPLAPLALTLVNLALGMLLYTRQQISARLLQGASVTVQLLFAIALITILR
jgi:hypothetical protein